MKFETLAIHAGRAVDSATGAVSMPLHTSTTFERDVDGSYPHGFSYIRDANPNRNAFEQCMAALEGGGEAVAFSSGMAAIAAILEAQGKLASGSNKIVLPHDMYFGIRGLIAETGLLDQFEIVESDLTDLDHLSSVVSSGSTSLIWAETPSNPLVSVSDIKALANIAHAAGALLAVDNTWGTPALQRPLTMGADAVIHSATKYIGGHSDTMLGVVALPEKSELSEPLRAIQKYKGMVPSPFDCWIALRGVQTLALRMDGHCRNAQAVAEALLKHPGVEKVLYPGLPGDPGHEIAKRQMSGFGGMLSFIVAGGDDAAMRVTSKLKLITRATSLGGTHTLIEHRASIEGPGTTAPPGLLRMSIGLEHHDDIIGDLQSALDAAGAVT